jgi:pimeloyl-ACP methyl ester carboxylesterase
MIDRPETRYTRSGDVNIAYQTVGDGPLDLVFVHGWVSNLEWGWQEPGFVRTMQRLASFSRLILFDKRGTGLSDRVSVEALPTMEQRMDDLRAVMDAAASERAALFGFSEGGPLCALFAATFPERTRALVAYGSYARWVRADDYPWAPTREAHERSMEQILRDWGKPFAPEIFAPSVCRDERFLRSWASYLRNSASPAAAIALYRMNIEIDVRAVLPAIQAPTLILHRTGDRLINVGCGRYLAGQIPGARLVELPGEDHLLWANENEDILGETQEFLTGVRDIAEAERVLATVLFVDLVASTEKTAHLGDRRWVDVLATFLAAARDAIDAHRGREIDTAGDGIFAAFDGPARAIRCACAIRAIAAGLGLHARAGLHTGECLLLGQKISGIAVHTGARVMAEAGPGEVLVSRTVKDLVAGSGLRFTERGTHTLRGVPGEWQLFAVAS